MNEKIKFIRKKEKLSQSEFGKILGVSRDVIANIEYGRVKPKLLLINHLCNVFDISKEWLLNDLGEMYSINVHSKNTLNINEKNEKLHFLISKLEKLDNDYIEIIDDLVESLLKKQNKNIT